MEEERVSHGGFREALLQVASFSGEHDRREPFQALQNGVQFLCVRVFRELKGLLRFRAVHGPFCLALGLRVIGDYVYGVFGRVNGLDGPEKGVFVVGVVIIVGPEKGMGWENGFGAEDRGGCGSGVKKGIKNPILWD